MKGNVILVGGSKGGVGKSMVSISLVDYYLERQRPLVLIETDSSNPDVFKIYKQLLDGKTYAVDLDSKDGWLNMMNIIADNAKDSDVIINTAARSNVGIEQHGSMLNDALEDLNRNLITLWPINRQRDSVQLLQMYMNKMTASEIYVFRNTYFGEPDKFQHYNDSKIKSNIEARWKTFNFSDLADRVTDEIISKRLPLSEALASMPFGNCIELKRWRADCAAIYDSIFGA